MTYPPHDILENTEKPSLQSYNTSDVLGIYRRWCAMSQGINLYDYQEIPARTMLDSVLNIKGQEIFVCNSRQSGKTENLADISSFLAIFLPTVLKHPEYQRGIRIGMFAPKWEQASIPFSRLRSTFNEGVVQQVFGVTVNESSGDRFRLSNGSFIKCITASDHSSIEGETFDFMMVDECQSVSDLKIRKSIQPMGSATNATTVYTGTPSLSFINEYGKECRYFYEGLRDSAVKFVYPWSSVVVSKHAMYKKDGKPFHLRYKAYVEKILQDKGEDDDYFRTQYNCEWILERAMFIMLERLMSCQMAYRSGWRPNHELPSILSSDYRNGDAVLPVPVWFGVDVGKKSDPTVVTCGTLIGPQPCDVVILDWLVLHGEDYPSQAEMVQSFITSFGTANIRRIYVDSVGVGDPFTDMLKRKLPFVEPFCWTAPKHDNAFRSLMQMFSAPGWKNPTGGKIIFPEKVGGENQTGPTSGTKSCKKFIQQFTDLEKDYRGDILSCHAPEREGCHDDFCSSLALLLMAAGGGYRLERTLIPIEVF